MRSEKPSGTLSAETNGLNALLRESHGLSCESSQAGRWPRFWQRVICLFVLSPLLLAPAIGVCQTSPTFERVDIGAFDPDAWNGIVFLARAFHQPAGFALRVGSQADLACFCEYSFRSGLVSPRQTLRAETELQWFRCF